jgi:DNA polymerase V
MLNLGLHPGDILIVDKSIAPLPNNIVIAVVDGEFLVKRLITKCGTKYLVPDNPNIKRIELGEVNQVEIWGVLVWVIHKLAGNLKVIKQGTK